MLSNLRLNPQFDNRTLFVYRFLKNIIETELKQGWLLSPMLKSHRNDFFFTLCAVQVWLILLKMLLNVLFAIPIKLKVFLLNEPIARKTGLEKVVIKESEIN